MSETKTLIPRLRRFEAEPFYYLKEVFPSALAPHLTVLREGYELLVFTRNHARSAEYMRARKEPSSRQSPSYPALSLGSGLKQYDNDNA